MDGSITAWKYLDGNRKSMEVFFKSGRTNVFFCIIVKRGKIRSVSKTPYRNIHQLCFVQKKLIGRAKMP